MLFRSRPTGLAVVLTLLASASAIAQEAPPPSRLLPYPVDSGVVSNATGELAVIASFPVEVRGATWVRLHFSDVLLGGSPEAANASIVRVTSYLDGATQELDQLRAREWRNTTAYFNGDTVQVELLAHPGTGENRLVLERVEAGEPADPTKSQCGPTDDRVLSSDPRSARAMPIGCTAWMINDCNHCFLTAGHCCCSSLQVMEFNVPLSTAGGSIVHPPPQDQYAVDASSIQTNYTGIGNDWAYFGAFTNTSTGMTAYQKQGNAYTLANPPAFNPAHVIRITGYGVDSSPAQNNQVQQTHFGPLFAISGTALYYQVDTEGGNSGSAVQWESGGGVAIGIHTNAGCGTSSGNSGTGVNNSGLQAALANPKGVCVPVAKAVTYCTAKVTSNGCTPAIGFTGTPSASGATPFHITANNVINQKTGVLFYGYWKGNTAIFGGTLCIGGTLKRTPVQNSNGSASGSDCTGTFDFDMGAHITSGVDPALGKGKAYFAQYWFRDSGFTPPNNVGLTNALEFDVGI
ncbi:MAG: hypothetical protein L6Q99_11425 [Planctomycetes bacterium]|nr:hypothetical protein [Planctomycetota bacterium]